MSQDRPTPAGEFERVRRGLLRIARESVTTAAPFPGELELARRLACGRGQVRRVMGSLEHDGIVMRRQGVPTRIDPATLALSMRLDERRGVENGLRDAGYTTSAIRLSITERVAPAPAWARVDGGELRIVSALHLFTGDGAPAIAEQSELIDGVLDTHTSDIDDRVWEAWRESVLWDVTTIGASAVDAAVADALGVTTSTVLPSLDSVHIARSGRHVARSVRWHLPEFFTFAVLRSARPRWDDPRPSEQERDG